MFYEFLDIFFMIFHSGVILFNLFGWIWKKTRRWNLLLLLLTAASWFILGIWYGWGYCICTDWHWDILRELGWRNLPASYVKFLLWRIFGLDLGAEIVNRATVILFFAALLVSVLLNVRDFRKSRKT